jgi:hypothetical protein
MSQLTDFEEGLASEDKRLFRLEGIHLAIELLEARIVVMLMVALTL